MPRYFNLLSMDIHVHIDTQKAMLDLIWEFRNVFKFYAYFVNKIFITAAKLARGLPHLATTHVCKVNTSNRNQLWISISPFWFLTDDMLMVHGVANCCWMRFHPPVFYRFWTRVASWSLTNPTSCCRARPVSLVPWWKGLESLRSLNIDCIFLAVNWQYVDCTWSP